MIYDDYEKSKEGNLDEDDKEKEKEKFLNKKI